MFAFPSASDESWFFGPLSPQSWVGSSPRSSGSCKHLLCLSLMIIFTIRKPSHPNTPGLRLIRTDFQRSLPYDPELCDSCTTEGGRKLRRDSIRRSSSAFVRLAFEFPCSDAVKLTISTISSLT